jgi:hypothetical protein
MARGGNGVKSPVWLAPWRVQAPWYVLLGQADRDVVLGASIELAALRGYAGCEVLAVSTGCSAGTIRSAAPPSDPCTS